MSEIVSRSIPRSHSAAETAAGATPLPVRVLLPLPLRGALDYRPPEGGAPPLPGQFVRVSLGSRRVVGVVRRVDAERVVATVDERPDIARLHVVDANRLQDGLSPAVEIGNLATGNPHYTVTLQEQQTLQVPLGRVAFMKLLREKDGVTTVVAPIWLERTA